MSKPFGFDHALATRLALAHTLVIATPDWMIAMVRCLLVVCSALLPFPAWAQLPPGLPKLAEARACPPPSSLSGGQLHRDARAITNRMLPALVVSATKPATLRDRMAARRVPGVSVAVIRSGRLLWAQGFGIRDTATCQPVTSNTAFQAGSISKSFAAVLAMQAVERGDLALDRDINTYLTRWKLPNGSGVPTGTSVTLAQLLSHTAAVSAPSSAGVRPGEPVPTIVQSLRGEPPALGPAVAITGEPGREHAYSNGGYHVVQLALEDVSGRSFASLADREILEPLGMSRSSFVQPSTYPERATGHHEGLPFADKAYLVPELAAGGLWTTPSDLARFLIAMRDAANGRDTRLLSQASARRMIEKGPGNWGLGFSIEDKRFGHDGGFWGMMSRMWIDQTSGDGIVVLANDYEGIQLANEIIRATADHYRWPGLGSRSFTSARDAGPLYVRGTMNNWGTANRMTPAGRHRFQTVVDLPAGTKSFKIASEDWRGFVLGSPRDAATIGRPLALSPDGEDIELTVTRAGKYRILLDAPDTGQSVLRVTPVTPSE